LNAFRGNMPGDNKMSLKGSQNIAQLNKIANSFESRQSDPSFQIIDLLDNIWCGYMVDFDGTYSENQDIPKQELRRLTQILQLMEKNCAVARVEFERRLNGECSPSP
jgi:hypothetical protein